MKLNRLEFLLMNNPVREWCQRSLETPNLILPSDALRGNTVLEIGCGRGVGVEILLSLGAAHVTGIDIDPEMIVLAAHRLAKYDNRALVMEGDAESLVFPDHSFDVVVEYGILHHVPRWQLAIVEIARVLKPGGYFFFEDLLRGLIASRPMQVLFDHPQVSQFTSQAFFGTVTTAGLCIEHWRVFGRLGLMGRAVKPVFTR